MPWVVFVPTIPASELAKTVHVLDRSATVTGLRTDFQYYILLAKMRGLHLKIYEICNELRRRIITEIEENLSSLWQLCSTPSFKFFEEYPTESFLTPNTIFFVQPTDMGITKKLEVFISFKIGKLHPSSNSEKSIDITFNRKWGLWKDWCLEVGQFSADTWWTVSTKTLQNCFAHCGFNTETWRCRIGPVLEMTSYSNCNNSEITKSFHASTFVFKFIIQINVGINEWLIRMLEYSLLDYDFISCRKETNEVTYLH
jgi:hypothetical protein